VGYLPNDDGVLGSSARSFDGLVLAYLGQSALLSPVDVEWALEGWGPDRVMTLCICLVVLGMWFVVWLGNLLEWCRWLGVDDVGG